MAKANVKKINALLKELGLVKVRQYKYSAPSVNHYRPGGGCIAEATDWTIVQNQVAIASVKSLAEMLTFLDRLAAARDLTANLGLALTEKGEK